MLILSPELLKVLTEWIKVLGNKKKSPTEGTRLCAHIKLSIGL